MIIVPLLSSDIPANATVSITAAGPANFFKSTTATDMGSTNHPTSTSTLLPETLLLQVVLILWLVLYRVAAFSKTVFFFLPMLLVWETGSGFQGRIWMVTDVI